MNIYNIKIFNKTNIFKGDDYIKVFIDGVEIKNIKSTFSHRVIEGKHILRIEQERIYRNKYSYALIPLYLLDLSLLDKSPFYAVYETEFYLDKDIDMTITLNRVSLKPKRFINIINCRFNVIFNSELERYLIKDEFIATDKERKQWLILSIIFITLPVIFLISLFSFFIFISFKQGKPLWGTIFFITVTLFLILVLIFLLRNCYVNYKYKDSKENLKG